MIEGDKNCFLWNAGRHSVLWRHWPGRGMLPRSARATSQDSPFFQKGAGLLRQSPPERSFEQASASEQGFERTKTRCSIIPGDIPSCGDAGRGRLLIALGNGIMTRYVYDTRNFRLLR